MARTTPYETGAQSGIGHRARPRHAGAVRRAESHRIVSFTDDERILQPACTELAYALQHQSKGSVSFAEMNGESLKERNEYRRLLHAAGFVDSPQGMKLYG